jgi:hypothetical protein
MDIMVAFSGDDAIDLYWGKGFRAEQIDADADFLLRFCDAVRRGRVREERWTLWGKTLQVASLIDAGTDQVGDRIIRPLWFLRGIAERSTRSYPAWD